MQEPNIVYGENKSVLTKFNDKSAVSFTVPDGVRIIGERAFAENDAIERVILPSSVLVIREGAFYKCSGLREINLENVAVIKTSAFEFCVGLSYAELCCGEIGDHAFAYCGAMERVTFQNTRNIGAGAFLNCRRISEIALPQGLEKIYPGAFRGCSVTEFVIPRSVKLIGKAAVNIGCKRLMLYENTLNFGHLWGLSEGGCEVVMRSAKDDRIIFRLVLLNDPKYYQKNINSPRAFNFETHDGFVWSKRQDLNRSSDPNAMFMRLMFQYKLSDISRERFLSYVVKEIFQRLFPSGCTASYNEYITEDNIFWLTDLSVKEHKTEFTALLMEYKERNFPNLTYDLNLE